MKRTLRKLAMGIGALLLIAVVILVTTAQLQWNRTFDAPLPQLHASTDPEVIARGAYLAYGPAYCAYCHTAPDQMARIDAGETPPLTGGYEWVLPLGTLRSRNITPDAETGIGRYSDGQLARMLRHGVRPDGRAALPFMEYQNLSDEDVIALISFLRSQQPVRHEVAEHDLTLMGKAIMAFLVKPVGPAQAPPSVSPPEGPTLERGAYLVNSVAACAGCHTQRNMMDGSFTGPKLAGGGIMEVDGDPTRVFVTPNLTPDPRTGRIANWSEEQFIARFRAGKLYEKSHMPWGPFGKMSDDDLRAIFRYLMSVEPVENETGPSLQPKA